MIRQFADRAVTTLNGALSDSVTAFTLLSDTGFPAAPFDVKIDNELLLVGARAGTTCSSVSRAQGDTVAAAHDNGATIRHVITAAALRGLLPVVRYKPSDTSRQTTSFSDDPDLFFPIGANEIWQFTFVLFASAQSTTPDIKVMLNLPAGAAVGVAVHSHRTIVGGTFPTVSNGESQMTGNATGASISCGLKQAAPAGSDPPSVIAYKGVVANGGVAGNVTLQWASSGSSATPTVLLANSHLVAREIES